jgi:superfamily II DNA or RNA helicase
MRLLIKGYSSVLTKGISEELAAKYPGGHWVTMHGRHVYVHNGRIVPETAWPGMTYEHHTLAARKAREVMAESSPAIATVKTKSEVADKIEKIIGAAEKQFGNGARGWFVVPKALASGQKNNTFEHKDRLKELGAVWKEDGAATGWHIPVKLDSGHAAKTLQYMLENGIHGSFRHDAKAPPYKGEAPGAPAPAQQGGTTQPPPAAKGYETYEEMQARLAAEKAAGLKIDVKIFGVGGKGYIGLKLTGYDNNDKVHRSFKNAVKKMDTAFHNGIWIFKGDFAKVHKQIEELHAQFGPMMNISEGVLKNMAEHNPALAEKLKSQGDRAKAGEAAQQVEDPVKIKTLKAGIKPHGYQWSGVHYLNTIEKGVLGFGTGLGKTLTSLLAAEKLKQEGKAKGPAVIVVPASRLGGWEREVHKFFNGKKVVKIDGGPEERKALYKEAKKADYVVMSYAIMTNEGAQIKKELQNDIAIFDEAHYLKDPKSARSKAAYEHMSPKYTWWLTATPMMNKLEETYRAMEFMNPGVLGEKKRFVQKFAQYETIPNLKGDGETKVVCGVKANERANLRKMIAPYFFMLEKQDPRVKIAMPPKTHDTAVLDMDDAQNKLYGALRGSMLQELEGMDGAASVDMHMLTQLMRLEQIAIDPRLIDTPEALEGMGIKATNPVLKQIRTKGYASPKIAEAADQIATNWERTNEENNYNGGKGTIVFGQSPRTLEFLKEQLKAEHGFKDKDFLYVQGNTSKKARDQAEIDFNAGKGKVILMTKAGTEGMNLQANSNMHIDLDYEWTPAAMEQRLGRGYRQGQENNFHHQQFEMANSIDQRKMSVLERKGKIISDVFGSDGGVDAGKVGSKLTVADVLEMLGADAGTVAKAREQYTKAKGAAEERAAAKNAKAAAKAAADEAKAAAKAAAEAPVKASRAKKTPAPEPTPAKPKTGAQLNRERNAKIKADNMAAMEKLYGKGSGSGFDVAMSKKPIIRDADKKTTTQSTKTGYELAEEAKQVKGKPAKVERVGDRTWRKSKGMEHYHAGSATGDHQHSVSYNKSTGEWDWSTFHGPTQKKYTGTAKNMVSAQNAAIAVEQKETPSATKKSSTRTTKGAK